MGGNDTMLALELAAGSSYVAAAQKVGVSERTARRRAQDPGFVREVEQWRDHLVSETAGQLVGSLTQAASTLRALLEAESESVRLRAASTLIDTALRVREHFELQCRIAAVEDAQSETDNVPWEAQE